MVFEFSVLKDGGAKGWGLPTDALDKVAEEVAVGGQRDVLEVALLHVASWHARPGFVDSDSDGPACVYPLSLSLSLSCVWLKGFFA